MSNLVYFQSKRHQTPDNKTLLKFIPRNKDEGPKADKVRKMFSEEQYIRYLALVMIYRAYNFMPKEHQEVIKDLTKYGIFDELAVSTKTNLTNCYVSSNGEFIYDDIGYALPKGYIPRVRIVDENDNIYVEAFSDKGERNVFQFIYYNDSKKHIWKRADKTREDFLLDF